MRALTSSATFMLVVSLLATSASAPAQQVTKLAAGGWHSLALLSDGTVKAWGGGWLGQLGLGSNLADRHTPQLIPNLTGVVDIEAGGVHSLALLGNGTVMAWGSNAYGQIGTGSTTDIQSTPQLISGLTNVIKISTESDHSLALLGDGTVRAWGRNQNGQLGIGNTIDQNVPQQVFTYETDPAGQPMPLTGVSLIAAGTNHSTALKSLTQIWAWGWRDNGQLSDCGSFGPPGNNWVFAWVANEIAFNNIVGLTAGLNYTLTRYQPQQQPLPMDPSAKKWGSGTTTGGCHYLTGYGNIAVLEGGAAHVLVCMSDGTARAWGANSDGQLGIGTNIAVGLSGVQTISGLTGVVSMAAGQNFSLALLNDGTVKAWGANGSGQLGLNNNVSHNTPQSLTALTCGAYSLSIIHTNSVLGVAMNCGGAIGASKYYFNVFSTDPQNSSNPGGGWWSGLYVSESTVIDHLNLALGGFALVFGQLNPQGSQTAWLTLPTAALAGLTMYSNSFVINPLTNTAVLISPVTSHAF